MEVLIKIDRTSLELLYLLICQYSDEEIISELNLKKGQLMDAKFSLMKIIDNGLIEILSINKK